ADKSPFPENADNATIGWDDGVISHLRRFVEKHPDDAFALGALGVLMDYRKLNEKNNSSGDAASPEKLLAQAISVAPKNPLPKISLAVISDDSNEARHAAESAYKSHPQLPGVLEALS